MLVSTFIGLLAGLSWGLLVFIVASLLFTAWHLRNLQRLVEWTHQPIGTVLPRARGTWEMVFADIGRRIRAGGNMRNELSVALTRFHDACQAMPDGVMYLSESDTIEWMNIKAEQHFGLDRTYDLGAPVTNLVRQPEFVRFLQAGLFDLSLKLQSSRSIGRTLQVQIVPFGENQKLVMSRDISQLEWLETMRRDFVANVSHELRTPLTVISGFLETLMDGLDEFERDEIIRYLGLAHTQSLRMHHLIEDLLKLSALETAPPIPAEEKVRVDELLQQVRQEAEILSNGRHEIAVIQEKRGDILFGSYQELYSAFSNLVNNAVRYTSAGGKITISWRRDESGGEFSVADNGIGIESEHIPRLTERFYRVVQLSQDDTDGTGLGLAIVKHTLSRHQAELHIESVFGQGSRFSARFPRARLAF